MTPIKGKVSQITTCRKEYKIVTNEKLLDRYWDEGCKYHKSKGRKKWKKKKISWYKVREYRTWKHNRKTQYKMKKIFDQL